MSKPHPELKDHSPLEVGRTKHGARRVVDFLAKLFYGLPLQRLMKLLAHSATLL